MKAESGYRRRVRTRLPAPQRRAQILSQAATLFMERGYAGVGVDDIGASVGVSGPAVYRHVSGKEHLVSQIVTGWLDGLHSCALTCLQATPAPPATERLHDLVSTCVEYATARVPAMVVVLRYADAIRCGDAMRFGAPDLVDPQTSEHIDARLSTISDLWWPLLVAAYPHRSGAHLAALVRAAAGLVIGAADASRDIPRATRIDVLTEAIMALLDSPIETPPADQIATSIRSTWARASRREQILDTAVRMFSERGYGGVSMADIAAQVGVTPSASYRHFASKEELLATAVERAGERLVLGVGTALATADSATSAINAMLGEYINDVVANRDEMAVHATERYHLAIGDQAAARRRDRVVIEEWMHVMATLRPELTAAEREMLVLGAHRLAVEVARGLRPHEAGAGTRFLHAVTLAVLGVHPD